MQQASPRSAESACQRSIALYSPPTNRSHSLCRGGTKVAPAVLGRRLQKRGRRVDGRRGGEPF